MGVVLLMEEILRSPVEVGSLPHYVQGFFTSQVVIAGFLNHQLRMGSVWMGMRVALLGSPSNFNL